MTLLSCKGHKTTFDRWHVARGKWQVALAGVDDPRTTVITAGTVNMNLIQPGYTTGS